MTNRPASSDTSSALAISFWDSLVLVPFRWSNGKQPDERATTQRVKMAQYAPSYHLFVGKAHLNLRTRERHRASARTPTGGAMSTLPQPGGRTGLRLVHSQKLPKMSRGSKIAAIIVAAVIVILLCTPLFLNANSFRPKLEAELTQTLGRTVKVGNLSVSMFSGSVNADNISIADDPAFSNTDFVHAKSLRVGVELIPLVFSKTMNVTDLTLNQPEINLIRSQNGEKWNFSSLGNNNKAAEAATQSTATEASSSSAPQLSVNKLNVNDGRVTVSQLASAQPTRIYDKVDVAVSHFSFNRSFLFKLSMSLPTSGALKLAGKAGPINANDAALTSLQAKVIVEKMNLAASGFIDPASGISGIADFVGTVTSDGGEAKTNGAFQVQQLKVAKNGSPAREPVQLQYATTYNLANQTGTINQGNITLGKAIAHMSGTYDAHIAPTSVNMKLNGQSLPVDSLEAMLPAFGVNLPPGSQLKGGTLSLDFSIVGPVDKLVTTGSFRLENSSLAGFNLGSKLSSIPAFSGKAVQNNTSIQNFSSNVRVAPEGTYANNIELVIPALGTATGSGTVSPSNALDFHMKADNIPFMIQGTTSDPKFMPDIKGMANGLMQKVVGTKNGKKNPL
jgi:AsmA protein